MLVLAAAAAGQDAPALRWLDASELTVEGMPFAGELEVPWSRLPARAEALVRKPVWDLSTDSAGIVVRFVSDADRIDVRWTLRRERLAMGHMPSRGVSGVDLYVEHEGALRWLACGEPGGRSSERTLVKDLPRAARSYALYLPLYNGCESLEIGVPDGCSLEPAAPRTAGPIVFYGTSITHGACASRPGTCHVARLGRRLDREVVNLGFSGNGRLEMPLCELIAELDAAVYVLDCLPNLDGAQVRERLVPFVLRLRELRPDVPIVLAEDRNYADAFLVAGRRLRNDDNQRAFRDGVAALRERGVDGLFVVPATAQLGADGDDTADGSHPTDLGFLRMADGFEPALRAALAWHR